MRNITGPKHPVRALQGLSYGAKNKALQQQSDISVYAIRGWEWQAGNKAWRKRSALCCMLPSGSLPGGDSKQCEKCVSRPPADRGILACPVQPLQAEQWVKCGSWEMGDKTLWKDVGGKNPYLLPLSAMITRYL